MVAPLNTCTTIEQRGVVRFLWTKDVAAKDIHKEMLPTYSEHCLSRQANPLKQHLLRERFPDDDAIESAVCTWFRELPQEFYAAIFQGRVKR